MPQTAQAMDDAVRPAVAVARIRALAESRGGSLEDISAAANAALAAGTDVGFGDELDERLRGELARAVVEQDRTQNRAAALVQ